MNGKRTSMENVRYSVLRKILPIAALFILSTMPFVSSAAKIPAGFESYAKVEAGEGLQCVVGDITDQDAMNGRAYVYLEEKKTHRIQWSVRIPLPPNRYQNRATHCLSDPGKIYVLVQSDTSQAQALSQTFVDVVTMDKTTGRIESTGRVIAAQAGRAPSTWVEAGAGNFRMENGKIVVTGKYFNLQDPDTRKSFTASPTP